MRLCRIETQNQSHPGVYTDAAACSLEQIGAEIGRGLPAASSLLEYLPGGEYHNLLLEWEADMSEELVQKIGIPLTEARLLTPIPHPSKILLLAGNYAKHIAEGGGRAEERADTFPYVFMKPPTTTLTHPGDPIRLPNPSSGEIDWELELGVVIGRRCSQVAENEALNYVAGYTVVNDISDRAFRPNPQRKTRPKDVFFDWLHGKWHDTFCPVGPCILPASEHIDPQNLKMQLRVNEEIEQDASTAEMVFPVAAVIAFISSFVTLEPGDIISTGTPSGVGKAKGKFLQHGDTVKATIERIGNLENPVV